MRGSNANLVGRAYRWLNSRPSYMLLTADDESLRAQPPRRFVLAWLGLLVGSLGWGALLATVWMEAWVLFGGQSGLLTMPAACATVVFVIWPYRRAMTSAGGLIAGKDSSSGAAVSAALVVGLAIGMGSMWDLQYHTEFSLPRMLDWVRPWSEACRALVLMPLWGAWAMIVTSQFCRCPDHEEPAITAFRQGCGPLTTAGALAAIWGFTWLYLGFMGWRHLLVSAAATLSAAVFGVIFCRRSGGLKRSAMLAASVVTQLVFLATYLAVLHSAISSLHS